jgi:hypothetical protein
VTNPATLTVSANTTRDSIFGGNRGTGDALSGFSISGKAVRGTSSHGIGGFFEAGFMNFSNPNAALEAHSYGLGSAAVFAIGNSNNNRSAIDVRTSGTGPAAAFQITNSNSNSFALFVRTSGTGSAVFAGSSGGGGSPALSALKDGTGPAIYGESTGGPAGLFRIGPGNPNPTLEAESVGTGPAARFKGRGKGLGAAALVVESTDTTAGEPAGIAIFGLNRSGDASIVAQNTSAGDLFRGIGSGGSVVYAVRNNGMTVTTVLQITGGADLSEQFEVGGSMTASEGASSEPILPGTLVSIDPEKPGKLLISSKSYDRKVAGVISGAGGLRPGMLMSQSDSAADGQHPVALTGRVYCWADAAQGPIDPGDLLTTSDAPGHAMKVTDHARAQGAIIGKAMTSLKEGRGLVLVLVALQ